MMAGVASMFVATACTEGRSERTATTRAALDAPLAEALCEAPVDGLGTLATETDYLPQVIACENNGADFEALKAQAIAARSVLYWTVGTHGSICNGTGCQAYSCNNAVEPIHQQAVDATSGRYLAYAGNVTYAFYVNGDPDTAPPTCVGDPAAPNEQWITYNEGFSGPDVQQTALGSQHDTADAAYGQNRGCMGQWGARCLESLGYDHEAILRAFYGDDIQILKAEGPCVLDDPMGEGGAGGAPGSTSASGGAATVAEGGGAAVTSSSNDEGSCRYAPGEPGRSGLGFGTLALLCLAARRRRRTSVPRPAAVPDPAAPAATGSGCRCRGSARTAPRGA